MGAGADALAGFARPFRDTKVYIRPCDATPLAAHPNCPIRDVVPHIFVGFGLLPWLPTRYDGAESLGGLRANERRDA